MKTLNSNHNLFSVAPVGSAIIIARNKALRGGLSREAAMNLIGWLVISTNATPEEIKAVIAEAHEEPTAPNSKKQLAPVATSPAPTNVAPGLAAEVKPFIGAVDAEEAAALEEGVKRAGEVLKAGGATTPVNSEELLNRWG